MSGRRGLGYDDGPEPPINSEDADEVPLQDKRPFGSGLKRKRVVFVPASTGTLDTTTEEQAPARSSKAVSDLYLSLVLPKDKSAAASGSSSTSVATESSLCGVCSLPVDGGSGAQAEGSKMAGVHEASIAHQVCMSHSHPPSALDRSRMGLNVLQSQGWDPDARTGLGADQQGIQFPIKPKPKDDTLGLGLQVPKNLPLKAKKAPKLDAKKARAVAAQDKKRHERLREQFYGNPEIDKYLGRG